MNNNKITTAQSFQQMADLFGLSAKLYCYYMNQGCVAEPDISFGKKKLYSPKLANAALAEWNASGRRENLQEKRDRKEQRKKLKQLKN